MKTLAYSVRNIVEAVLRNGDLDASLSSLSRMQEGTRIHQKIQAQRKGEFEKEVLIKSSFVYGDVEWKIEGRADLLAHRDNKLIIGEIKSTGDEHFTEHEVHFAQGIFYGYLYQLMEKTMDDTEIQLIYYHRHLKKEKTHTRTYTMEALQEYVEDVLDKFLYHEEQTSKIRILAKASGKTVAFPYPEYRKHQHDFMKVVYHAIDQKKKLYANAPTGTGKTLSTLYPALKALSEGLMEQIFYVTAKNVGRETALTTMKKMTQAGYEGRTLSLTAKEKICFQEEVDCRPEVCPYAKGFYGRLSQGLYEALEEYKILDRSAIEKVAQRHILCPFEFGLELFYYVQVIIGDYNYVFDPRVALKRNDENHSQQMVLLVDEAHNLLDRVRDMYSAVLHKDHLLSGRRRLKKKSPAYKYLSKMNRIFLDLRKDFEEEIVLEELPPGLIEACLGATEELREILAEQGSQDPELLDLYFELLSFLRIEKFLDHRFVLYASNKEKKMFIKQMLIDPHDILNTIMKDYRSVALFSATLSPMDYYQYFLGGTPDDYTLRIPSPFSPDQLHVKRVSASTYFKDRQDTMDLLRKEILTFAQQEVGNFMVFFPSYQYLQQVLDGFDCQAFAGKILVQSPNQSEEEKKAFLEAFQDEPKERLLAFAVLGGQYAEGIDLVGDRLKGVFITGVGLPMITYERTLMKEYFDQQGQDGFYLCYVVPGMNKVLQAGGRVIRSEQDQGYLVLFGKRFFQASYRQLLPYEWRG